VIAVVVVNWNDTETSVRALRSARAKELVVPILVDNASATDPTQAARDVVPDAVVQRLPVNAGYAAACNRGTEIAIALGARFVLVMNNDAELAPDALDRLVSAGDQRPGSILAPLIVYAEAPDEVWSAGGYVQPPCVRNHHVGIGRPRAAYTRPRRVEWATGCALLFGVDTFKRIGPFDEKFFLYLEDVDWCLRAARRSVGTWLIPDAVVYHDVSRTTGGLSSSTIRYYAYRNHFRLAFRHTTGWARGAVAVELVWTLAKIGVRSLAFRSYRHDPWYHARTRAIRDFLLGRWGPDPVAA
jgi:GT2 family glycosyltransferase